MAQNQQLLMMLPLVAIVVALAYFGLTEIKKLKKDMNELQHMVVSLSSQQNNLNYYVSNEKPMDNNVSENLENDLPKNSACDTPSTFEMVGSAIVEPVMENVGNNLATIKEEPDEVKNIIDIDDDDDN